MANIDKKGNNRFTNAASSEDVVNQFDNNDIVLNILKDEFPDDPFFARDMLGPLSADGQALDNGESIPNILMPAKRNTKNVLNLSTERDEYATYDLAKTFPTIDEDELDDIIDEEWEYFEDPAGDATVSVESVKPSGLFLVNSDVDLYDIHDSYISSGPQTIEGNEVDITNRVFCVFFIQNGIAYVIPTYKTLEVMLVQRGLTYDAIFEATPEQAKEFDLAIDGNSDDEFLDANSPLEEFRERSYPVLDSNWDYSLRYRSGYRPKAPFIRDPGDYIKPESVRSETGRSKPGRVSNIGAPKSANSDDDSQELVDTDGNVLPLDVYYDLDKDDRYFDQVFQKQTSRERLREKFEGKMIIGDWPSPVYKNEEVGMGTEIVSDDAVRNLRIMINGHWKFLDDGAVMKLYAYLNDYDISAYVQGQGRYGTNGYIQLLIDAGGCTVIQAGDGDSGTNDTQTGNSDMANEVEPLWNAFPHIIEADDDGVPGVDKIEYQEYLDNFTNGGDPFGIEYLQPFEPAGSIKYYHKQQYQALVAQSILQGQINVIKEQIYEVWPAVAALIQNTKTQLDALPSSTDEEYGPMRSHVNNTVGTEGPLYKVMKSTEGKWNFVKKKGDEHKIKASENLLFKLCSKKLRIKNSLNESEELKFVDDFKWMKNEDGEYDLPPWRKMEDDDAAKGTPLWRQSITDHHDVMFEKFRDASIGADKDMSQVSKDINEIYDGMGNVDVEIMDASSVEEFQQLFEYIISVQSLCNDLNDDGLFKEVVTLRNDIDLYLKDQLKRQYNAIQYLRKKVYQNTNSKKYGIIWPAGPQNILNEYVPGCTFDNYIPKVD
jgi:hypothetical protein